MTIQNYADIIANTLNQPFNHELKERIKVLIKQETSLIINKLANKGITQGLTLSYDIGIENTIEYTDPINLRGKYKVIKSINNLLQTVRIRKDAPLLAVTTIDGRISLPYKNSYEASISASFSSIGESFSYHIKNNTLYINNNKETTFKPKYLRITDIFESPEEVLSLYQDIPDDEVDIPITMDVFAMIQPNILNILTKTPIDDANVKTNEQ